MKIKNETTNWGTIHYYKNSYCRFALYAYDDKSTIYLSNIKVKKSERGKEIGNKILEFANKEARKHNYSTICLKALKSSWMHDWYAKHGYRDLSDDDENDDYIWLNYPQAKDLWDSLRKIIMKHNL